MLAWYFMEQGYDVIGYARKTSSIIPTVIGDAHDRNILQDVISNKHFDVIINCIGILNKSAEDNKVEAVFINSYIPHLLAKITENTVTQIIQVSTDCVFSGDKGNYCEYDFRDGNTFYDRTKALGELDDNKNVTIRSSIVGPDQNPNGIGLLNWFLKQRGEIDGYQRVLWTGQTTLQYAKTIEAVARAKIHGIYNLVPNRSISKYDLLQLFNKYLRNNKITIRAKNTPISDKSLKRTRFDFNYYVPDYEDMVYQLALWMRSHKELYPHYQLNYQ